MRALIWMTWFFVFCFIAGCLSCIDNYGGKLDREDFIKDSLRTVEAQSLRVPDPADDIKMDTSLRTRRFRQKLLEANTKHNKRNRKQEEMEDNFKKDLEDEIEK